MDVQVARQQWEDGRRRVDALRFEREAYERLSAQVDLLVDELRKRVGITFTLADLADAYSAADDWARELLVDAGGEGADPPDTATAADAAFERYAHRASDYAP